MDQKLYVLVPTDRTKLLTIDPQSAIVGHLGITNKKMMHIFFESGRYQKLTYREKVREAAARCLEKAPTVARMVVPRSTVRVVGTYEYDVDRIHINDEDAEALEEWLNAAAVVGQQAPIEPPKEDDE